MFIKTVIPLYENWEQFYRMLLRDPLKALKKYNLSPEKFWDFYKNIIKSSKLEEIIGNLKDKNLIRLLEDIGVIKYNSKGEKVIITSHFLFDPRTTYHLNRRYNFL